MPRKTERLLAVLLTLALFAAACSRSPAERARKYRERAEAYLKEGKAKEASIEFQAALQTFPKDADALYGLAQALNVEGQAGQYRDTLKRVLAVDPNHPRACVGLGGLLWASGNYPQALEMSERALVREPKAREALTLKAKALASLGRREESRVAWDKVLSSSEPVDRTYFDAANFEAWAGDRGRARSLLEQGLTRFPRSSGLLLALAEVLFLNGDLPGASAALDRAAAADPENPGVYVARAKFLFGTGRPAEAQGVLEAAQRRFSAIPKESADVALQRARILVHHGELKKARLLLDLERAKNPADPGLAAALADLLISEGDTKRAMTLLPTARSADPAGRTSRLLEARLYLREGRSYWALELLENLVAGGDLGVDTHLLYAAALAAERRWARARVEYGLVLRREPDNLLARVDLAGVLRAMGESSSALTLLNAMPGELRAAPRVAFLRARILLDLGAVDGARRATATLLKTAPDNPVLATLMGDADRAQRRWESAFAWYQRARDATPADVGPLFAQASMLLEQGKDCAQAVTLLQHAQEGKGEDPRILNEMASLCLDGGDLVSAARFAERSLQLEPNDGQSRLLRARIVLAGGDDAKAAVAFEDATKLNPLDPEAFKYLAEIQKRRGKVRQAEETYRRLLDRNPGEPQISNNLANLYLEQGKIREALQLAFEALAGAPRSPVILDTVGWALEKAGRPKEAFSYLEETARLLPDHPDVLLHRATNLKSLGRQREADELFARAERVRKAGEPVKGGGTAGRPQ